MRCRTAREHIKAYIDGELGPVTRWRVARHLANCMECSMEAEAMADLARQVAAAGEFRAPEGLREKVLSRVQFEAADAQWAELQAQDSERRWKWPYATSPIAVAGVLLFSVVAAAVLVPMFRQEEMRVPKPAKAQIAVPAASNAAPKRPSQYNSGEVVDAAPQPPMPSQRAAAVAKGSGLDTTNWSVKNEPAAKPVGTRLATPHLRPKGANGQDADVREAVPGLYSGFDGATPNAPLMVRTADVTVQVSSLQEANDKAAAMAQSAGGYVVRSSTNSNTGAPASSSLTLRVPVKRFEQTIERLGELGSVAAKAVNGEDAGARLAAMNSQLRDLRAQERQYVRIMNKAKRVTDMVAVSGKLDKVRGEIKTMTQRLDELKNSAAMSTVRVTLVEK